jgi:hypothetical protein
MPSIINASSSGSGGLVQTADASGVLQLQSNGSVGFTVGSTAVASGSSSATVGPFTNSSLGTFNGYLQIGSNLQLMSFANGTTNTQTQLTSNAYYNGAYRAIAGGAGASKLFIGGAGTFEFAGSNTLTSAGDIITFVPTLACGSLGQTVALQGASSVNGIGITFPATQSASTNANTLDDYEEGSFTPTPGGGSNTFSGSYTGNYTKIGNVVTVHIQVNLSARSGNDGITIALPFIVAGSRGGLSIGMITSATFISSSSIVYAQMDGGFTVVNLRASNNGTSWTPFTPSSISTNTEFQISGSYITS